MEQQELFLSEHLDKATTHNLCYYPARQIREGNTTIFEQPIALIPKSDQSIYTESEARTLFPFTVTRRALTVMLPIPNANLDNTEFGSKQ